MERVVVIPMERVEPFLWLDSLAKLNGATCYYVVVEEYIVGGGYPYQYKISFSAKNSFDMTVNDVAYYGYNSEYDSLKSYGSDSTKYNSASSGGKKQDIKI